MLATLRVVGRVWALLLVVGVVALLVSRALGFTLAVIETASMEPAIPRGTVVVTHATDPADVEVGDVILFADGDTQRATLHRVVDIEEGPDGQRFVTRGDANPAADTQEVDANLLDSRLVAVAPWLGPVASLLRSPAGFVVFVGVPLVLVGLEALTTRRQHAPATSPPGSGD